MQAMAREYELELTATRNESANGAVRTFVLPRPDDFSFTPGQFVWFEVAERTAYPMAIASGVRDPHLEFSIRSNPGNRELFSRRRGDRIRISSPRGQGFPLARISPDSPLLLVAGGTGVTPIRSILRSLPPSTEPRIVIGARAPDELLYQTELQGTPALTLTVEKPDGSWNGARGRVTEHLDQPGPETVAFVCGPDPMMAAVRDHLLSAGVPRERLYLSVQALNAAGEVLGPVMCATDPAFPL